MRKTLKKYFIPHPENDHKPHFLRREMTIGIAVALLLLEAAFFFGPGQHRYPNFFAAILSGVLVDGTNENRAEQNLPTLTINHTLEEAAKRKAVDMAAQSYFAHMGPDGKTPWEWLRESGYVYRYAGENLAVNFIDSIDVVNAWMASPGHKANILNERYTEIGIGTAEGVYKGNRTVFIVQYFGQPLFAASAGNPPPPSPIPTPQPAPTTAPTPAPAPTPTSPPIHEAIAENVLPESFVAFANPAPPAGEYIVGTNAGSSAPIRQSNIAERIATSPRTTVSYALMALAFVVLLALALKVFIAIEIQHPPLILNGILLLMLIGGAIIVNKYIGLVSAAVL